MKGKTDSILITARLELKTITSELKELKKSHSLTEASAARLESQLTAIHKKLLRARHSPRQTNELTRLGLRVIDRILLLENLKVRERIPTRFFDGGSKFLGLTRKISAR